MDILTAKMAEGQETVDEATRQLDAALLHATPSDRLAVAVDEAGLELDLARDELAAMREAHELLARVGAQLDDAGAVALTRAVDLLCSVDWPLRMDDLGSETQRLRELHTSGASD